MNAKVLIVEDQFIEANDLRLMLEKAGYKVTGIARSVPLALEFIEQERPDFVLLDIFLKGNQTGIDLAKKLREEHIAFIYLSANSSQDVLAAAKATQPYGFLVKPFREKDLLVTLEIAQYRHDFSRESGSRHETDLQKMLDTVIAESAGWEQTLLKSVKALQPHVPFDYISAGFMSGGTFDALSFLRVGFDEYQVIGLKELSTISGVNEKELESLQLASRTDKVATIYEAEVLEDAIREPSVMKLLVETFNLRSHIVLPVLLRDGRTFHFLLYSRRDHAYQPEHTSLFNRMHHSITEAIESMLSKEEPSPAVAKETQKPAESDSRSSFEGIIGNSHLLLNVFDLITQVAPVDTSVLVLGESGTGKERIADCIHQLSPRKQKPLVKINCAALPATLIESELFGHEKGAFTGATDKRIGKFEQAHGGTIFLDEIGEMPIELQVKLLRVLQEKEVERIGGKAPVKVDVRVIAATNRSLEKEVAEGRFRLDLYYRLNIFPIQLPPLRERKEDIPVLVDHFVKQFSKKAGKAVNGVSASVLKELNAYHWPGNIRELENLVERNVLLTKEPVISKIVMPVSQTLEQTVIAAPADSRIKTIDENERDHILSVLKKCNGKISGTGGAAELLGIPSSTLNSKIRKLGITKEHIFSQTSD